VDRVDAEEESPLRVEADAGADVRRVAGEVRPAVLQQRVRREAGDQIRLDAVAIERDRIEARGRGELGEAAGRVVVLRARAAAEPIAFDRSVAGEAVADAGAERRAGDEVRLVAGAGRILDPGLGGDE